MKKLIQHLRFFWPAILWSVVIFTFSSYPTGSTVKLYWPDFLIKKTAHMIEYGVLTMLMYRGFWNNGVEKKTALKYALIWAIFYGITDEVHQDFTPGREPAVRDIIFDTIGAGIAAFIIWKLLPIAPPRLKKWASDFQLI